MGKLLYDKCFESSKSCAVYSLDMVRLNYDFGTQTDKFIHHLQHVASYDLRYEVKYYQSFNAFAYRHLWNVSAPIDDGVSFSIGLDCGGTTESKNKGFIEFNPNKVNSSELLSCLLKDLMSYMISRELVRYDLAIDIPTTRSLVRLERYGRKGYQFIDSGNGCSEYLGQRNHNGYIKLYDKTKESNLSEDITRLEITLDKGADIEKVFPKVRILSEQTRLNLDYDLCESDKVLVSLLRDSDNTQFYLSSLPYRKRKKIEPYLADTTLLLDKKLALEIKSLAMSYEL